MTTSSTVLGLILLVIVISMIPTLAFASPSSPYSVGFAAGKRDAKTNLYDSTSACNDYTTINNTAAQTYDCLKGYSDGDTSIYHAGYLQGVQGGELKGTHTQEFIKGYLKGFKATGGTGD